MTGTHSHEIVPFKAAHVRHLKWAESEYMALIGQQAVEIFEKNLGWSGFCNGYFVGAGGIVTPYRGLGEGWAIAGPMVKHHQRWFHETCKRGIVVYEQVLGLVRHQVMVRDEFEVSHKWVQKLGFTYEATLKKYGVKGEDMRVYVRFP